MSYYGYDSNAPYSQGGGYGYEALYSPAYYGPYFLHATEQLSGPGSTAYEATYGAAGNFGVIQHRTGYAQEGSNGSMYEHDTVSQGYNYKGVTSYTRSNGNETYDITYTNDHSTGGAYSNYSPYSSHGSTVYTYNSFTTITDTIGANRGLVDYGTEGTVYADGSNTSFYSHSVDSFYNGTAVPGSFSGYDTRSYTDAYGYTTSSTQHFTG